MTEITRSRYDAKQIIVATANFFRKQPDELRGERRLKTLVGPRHVAMFLMRQHTNLSLPEIGALFSDRDHSTVSYAVHKVQAMIDAPASLLGQQLARIESDLESIHDTDNGA